jgi:hypothetical protein
MRKSASIAVLALLAAVTACAVFACRNVATQNAAEPLYEVMNPWADVDPIPPRGISPRLDSLDGKKIGLFANSKRSAVPQARMVEKKLKEKFPTIKTDLYHAPEPNYISKDSPDWGKFSAWIKSVDAIVLMVGD